MFVSTFVKSGFECYLSNAGFLLDLLFNPENEDDIFLGIICWFPTDYTALYFRR
jgi:hypothetical protein